MNNSIDRQLAIDAAIDAVDSWDGGCNQEREKIVREALEKLPPAQPETSILTVTVTPDSEEIERVVRKIKDAHVMVLPSADPEKHTDKRTKMHSCDLMPSAQPEIIRCKDCKHWDGVDTCDVIDVPVWDNDFCSMAERRTDD